MRSRQCSGLWLGETTARFATADRCQDLPDNLFHRLIYSSSSAGTCVGLGTAMRHCTGRCVAMHKIAMLMPLAVDAAELRHPRILSDDPAPSMAVSRCGGHSDFNPNARGFTMTSSTDPFSASVIPFQAPEQMRALAEKGLSQARDNYAKFKDVA